MRRRNLIGALGGLTATLPASLWAQSAGKVARIGIIDGDNPLFEHFRKELRDRGHVEGRNVAFDYVVGGNEPGHLAAAAAKLVRIPVDLIATVGTPRSLAAQAATRSIPIVAIAVGDPVGSGLAASLARPGGNVTGLTTLGPDTTAKRLQLLKEIVPTMSRVALMWNPDNPSAVAMRPETERVASQLGLTPIAVIVRSAADIDEALRAMMRERPDAVIMSSDPIHAQNYPAILRFLQTQRLPAISQDPRVVHDGGLLSYGVSLPELFRRGGYYAHQILSGKTAADLPFEQPTKLLLVLNLRTARSLDLTVSPAVLARADEVIE